MTQSAQHAKQLYPEMPLCIGYMSEDTKMTFVTSLDGDYSSLGYIEDKFPHLIQSFKNGHWFIDHIKTMSFGDVCYINSTQKDYKSTLEIPQTEMHLFRQVCGESREPICHSCGQQSVNLKKCARCRSVSYCNRECQTKDWKSHKSVCLPISI